jgi:hypothetical protein
MCVIVNIENLRIIAQKRLPKISFDYIDGGAFSKTTMWRNRTDFEKCELKQNVLRTSEDPSLGAASLLATTSCRSCWVRYGFRTPSL